MPPNPYTNMSCAMWAFFKILTSSARCGSKFISSPNREILVGVLFSCSITLNLLYWMIRGNSIASSAYIPFLLKSTSSLANLPVETSSSGIGPVLSLSSTPAFAFPLGSLDHTGGSGAAKIHLLRVMLLVPEMLVTLAEDKSSLACTTDASFLPSDPCVAYLHGTVLSLL